uniref:Uncharacterized protein n=1 Tax=viral metagenome TaxID=1070528 RepID=A0A6C0ICJ7_9ZZZZ
MDNYRYEDEEKKTHFDYLYCCCCCCCWKLFGKRLERGVLEKSGIGEKIY